MGVEEVEFVNDGAPFFDIEDVGCWVAAFHVVSKLEISDWLEKVFGNVKFVEKVVVSEVAAPDVAALSEARANTEVFPVSDVCHGEVLDECVCFGGDWRPTAIEACLFGFTGQLVPLLRDCSVFQEVEVDLEATVCDFRCSALDEICDHFHWLADVPVRNLPRTAQSVLLRPNRKIRGRPRERKKKREHCDQLVNLSKF